MLSRRVFLKNGAFAFVSLGFALRQLEDQRQPSHRFDDEIAGGKIIATLGRSDPVKDRLGLIGVLGAVPGVQHQRRHRLFGLRRNTVARFDAAGPGEEDRKER